MADVDVLAGPPGADLDGPEPGFVRVEGRELGMPLPVLFVDQSRFPDAGDYGFQTVSENVSGQWRPIETVVVDASMLDALTVFAVTGSDETGYVDPDEDLTPITAALFPDPHPQQWWDDMHDKTGLIMLCVGPVIEHLQPGGSLSWELLPLVRIGVCGLVVRAFDNGIGTRPPRQ